MKQTVQKPRIIAKGSTIENIEESSQTPSTISEASATSNVPNILPGTTGSENVEANVSETENKQAKSRTSKDVDRNILEIEIDPNALAYLKKNGDVFLLTDFENPQYTYYKIKGYEANLIY